MNAAGSPGPELDIELPLPKVKPTPRWVRVRVGDEWIADSRNALLLTWYGPGRLPTYCFPPGDVRMDRLAAAGDTARDGVSVKHDVLASGGVLPGAARVFHDPAEEFAALRDHVTFVWHDPRLLWFEEALQVHVHARDPEKRVDAVPSGRHIRVALDGTTVAESDRTVAVFETHLPTRWYFPPVDVRQDLLEATDSVSRCPYKGTARWWSVRTPARVHRDVAWAYPETVVEIPRIAGLVAFLNERVDLVVDDEPQRRPVTPWTFGLGESYQS